jgi:hypothetical protein
MSDGESTTTVRVQQAEFGGIWFVGWLFTIGSAQLELVQALIAIIARPYYLGSALA